MTEKTEHDLLGRFVRNGDEAAFREIVRRYLGLVLGTATRITGRPPLAEEVAQDVFALMAARAAALLRGQVPLAAWLHRTARFKAMRAVAAEQRRARKLERLMNEPDTSPDDPQEFQEALRPHLDAAMDALPSADRDVILLHFYERLPHSRIAERLGASPEAIRQRSRRAVERLAKLLGARRGVVVPAAVLTAGLSQSLTGPASAALAASIAQTALAAAPSVSVLSLSVNILQTMNTTQTAAIAVTVLCLSALTWQEIHLASYQKEVAALRLQQAQWSQASGLRLSAAARPASATATGVPAWDRHLADLRAGRLSPEALMEFARRVKRAREDNDPAAMPGLAQFAVLLQGPLLLKAAEMSTSLDLAEEDQTALWDLLLGSMTGQPEASLALAAHAWGRVPEKNRESVRKSATTAIREWLKENPPAALAWYRRTLESGKLSPGFTSHEPAGELAGALLVELMNRKTVPAEEFLTSLPAEARSPALTAAVRNTKSPERLQEIIRMAGTLPEAERTASLTAAAARLAQSASLAESAVLFGTIPFSSQETRNAAALETAVSSAINRNASSPVRQETAWQWLSEQTAGDSQKSIQSGFLSRLAGNDPAWALDRFDSIGGVSAGQEALSAFLSHIPDNSGPAAERYFRLAVQLEDSASQEAALARVVEIYKKHDPEAARKSLEAASLPGTLKTRLGGR
ncbi:MAG: sigma-70 family RNA polymerase sigma factor [Verrucomicrobiota bacterium]